MWYPILICLFASDVSNCWTRVLVGIKPNNRNFCVSQVFANRLEANSTVGEFLNKQFEAIDNVTIAHGKTKLARNSILTSILNF